MKCHSIAISSNTFLTRRSRYRCKQVPGQGKCNFVAKPCEEKADLWKKIDSHNNKFFKCLKIDKLLNKFQRTRTHEATIRLQFGEGK